MVSCKANKLCFYGGKRYRIGELVNFTGDKKDLPKYLDALPEEKSKAKSK